MTCLNAEKSKIFNQQNSKDEDIRCLRKRKDIIFYYIFNDVDENNTPDSIEYDKAIEPCPILKFILTESKKEHKTQPRNKQRKQKTDTESFSSMLPSTFDLTIMML